MRTKIADTRCRTINNTATIDCVRKIFTRSNSQTPNHHGGGAKDIIALAQDSGNSWLLEERKISLLQGGDPRETICNGQSWFST